MATISQEILDDSHETLQFRRWYAKDTTGIRRNFLASLVKWIMQARWTTAACMQFYLPKPFVFLAMPDLAEEPEPPYVHRIRFFPSLTPELYTWADVYSWYGSEDLLGDDEMLRNVQAEVDRAEFEEKEKLEARRRCHLEYRIMRWEDRRSEYLRIIEQELAEDDVPLERSNNGADYVNKRYKYYGDVNSVKEEDLKELKYEDGTGLQNEDEIRDEYELAQQQAEELREKRRELHRKIEEEKRRRIEEERLRKEEEERQRRLRETEKARERIKAYLEDLKQSRKEEAERKAMQAEEEYQKKIKEEEHAIKVREAQERLRKQQALQKSQEMMRKKLEQIAINKRKQEDERNLMHLEDVASAQVEAEMAEIARRRAEYLKYLEFVYAPVKMRGPSFQDAGNETLYWKGPQVYEEKQRRKHIDGYAIPAEEQILEDLETETFTVTKTSDKFIRMMGLPRLNESRSAQKLATFNKDELTLVELQRARSYSLLQDDTHDPLLMQPEKFQLTSKLRPQTELARTKPRPLEFTSSWKAKGGAALERRGSGSQTSTVRAQTTTPVPRRKMWSEAGHQLSDLTGSDSRSQVSAQQKRTSKKKKKKDESYKEHDLPPPFFRSAFGVQGSKKDISTGRPLTKGQPFQKSHSNIKFEENNNESSDQREDETESGKTNGRESNSSSSSPKHEDLPHGGSFGPF